MAEIALDLDEAKACVADAIMLHDELRSTIHDILTGANDVWAKRQLLALVDAADASLKWAMR